MHGEVAFKRGSDLAGSVVPHGMRSITCESCGKQAELAAAGDLGWQVRPPVCPDCLRWTAADLIADRESAVKIEKRGRFWAVYEKNQLLCLTVYRRGADAVATRIAHRRVGGRNGGS
jgi:hypothetical protein